MNDRRQQKPGRRDEDVTLADVLHQLESISTQLTTMNDLFKAWTDAKAFWRGIILISKGMKVLVGMAVAGGALWVLIKTGFIAAVKNAVAS